MTINQANEIKMKIIDVLLSNKAICVGVFSTLADCFGYCCFCDSKNSHIVSTTKATPIS
jgi:hypothetical protein